MNNVNLSVSEPSGSVDLARVHFIGIGGSGMSGLARIMVSRGATVTGSDMKDSTPVEVLRTMGAKVAIGHDANNLELSGELPTVVVTSFAAIPQDNPELVAARKQDIPVIRRSDLLAEIMEGYSQVLLAGTHGKTSTTSMTVSALQVAGEDPSFAIGGQLNRAGTNAHHGTGSAFIAEADESDASLLRYKPDVAVITNIEPDHLDYFKSRDAYFKVFEDFADNVGLNNGVLIVCLEDLNAAELGERACQRGIKVIGYGSAACADQFPDIPLAAELVSEDVDATGTRVQVRLTLPDQSPESTSVTYALGTPGHHMVLNSLAALLAGIAAGGDAAKLAQGLAEFTGVRRRFEYKGKTKQDIRVYDDYAHHPTEVAAVLTAARERVEAEGKGARVIACFQPHLYSRTLEFAGEFAQALSIADACVVLDIFGAREQPVEGVTSRIITDEIAEDVNVFYEPEFNAAPRLVAEIAKPGDIVLTMGAGSVTMLAQEILDALEASDGAPDGTPDGKLQGEGGKEEAVDK